MFDRYVRELQQALRRKGIRVPTHGRFDAATRAGMQRWQRARLLDHLTDLPDDFTLRSLSLPEDDLVYIRRGAAMSAAGLGPKAENPRRGRRVFLGLASAQVYALVRELQVALAEVSFDPIGADGKYGPRTDAAVVGLAASFGDRQAEFVTTESYRGVTYHLPTLGLLDELAIPQGDRQATIADCRTSRREIIDRAIARGGTGAEGDAGAGSGSGLRWYQVAGGVASILGITALVAATVKPKRRRKSR